MTNEELITAIKTVNDEAVKISDNTEVMISDAELLAEEADALTAGLNAAAVDLGVTGTSTMTNAELITAIKTVNDEAVKISDNTEVMISNAELAIRVAADNDTATNTAVSDATAFSTLAELIEAYNNLVNPTEVSSYTVTDSDLVVANATANGVLTVNFVGSPASATVTVESTGISYTNLILNTGTTNATVVAGDQVGAGDTITIVGSGTNDVTLGAGNDTLTVFGSGTTVVNAGTGDDTITLGNGSNNVTFAAGALGANDTVIGGTGNDTVTISGDGNVIGGAGATLTNVENIVLDGTTVSIAAATMATLTSVLGNPATSEVTLDFNGAAAALDLSAVSITGLEKIIISGGDANLTLTAAQIAQIGEFTGAAGQSITVTTNVAGLTALGSKASAGAGGTIVYVVEDTQENILAGAAVIAQMGASATLENAQTVAEAAAAIASSSSVSYNLQDTAANLALAPEAVYNNAIAVVSTDTATAAQAASITTLVTASNLTTAAGDDITAAQLTLNIADTGSNLAQLNVTEAVASDSVTPSDALTAKQAVDVYTNNNAATFAVSDTAAALTTDKAQDAMDNATSVSVTDAATVAQVVGFNTASDVDLTAGYSVTDSYANLITGTSTSAAEALAVVSAAKNVTVNDASITVAEAITVNNSSNTGTTSYVLDDATATMLAAGNSTVAGATAASVGGATVTAAQAASLVAKYTAAVFNDASLVISDTATNLAAMSAEVAAEANSITVSSGTATVAEAVALDAFAATDASTVNISDTIANLTAAASDATNLAIIKAQNAIAISDATSVDQVVALDALLAGGVGLTAVSGGYTLTDTNANLLTQDGAGEAVDDAAIVNVTDAISVAEVGALATAYTITGDDAVLGTSLNYDLADTPANILAAAGGEETGASSITATIPADTAARAVDMEAVGATFSINGDIAEIHTDASVTDAVLDAATAVTVTDTVANFETGTNLADMVADASFDNLVISDTLSNADGAADATKAAATNVIISDNNLTVANAATVNAFTNIQFGVVDAYADFITNGAAASEAIGTMLSKAQTVTLSDASTTVAEYNVINGLTSGSIFNNAAITGTTLTIADTISNLAAADAATAASAADTVTVSDTDGTAADIATLSARGVTVTGLTAVDTAANLTAMDSALLASLNSVTVSDNGAVTQNVAALLKIYTLDGSAYGNYSISDTAAAVATANGNNAGLSNFATAVTLSTDATIAEAANLEGITLKGGGGIAYNVTGTATLLAAADAADMSAAVNLIASDDATVAEAVTITAFTNSGTNTYGISDAIAGFIDANANNQAANNAAVEAASGTVTATGNATVAQAEVVSALTKAVVYSVSDTSANIANASATALNEAVDVASTGISTVAQANAVMAATNSGTTTVATVTDTAANVLNLTTGSNDVVTNVSVSDSVNATTANAIVALDTGTNITNTVVFAEISDTSTNVATVDDAVLTAATNVAVTNSMSIAEYTALDAAVTLANIDSYSLTDTFANLSVKGDPSGSFTYNTALSVATSVTVSDTLTIGQADIIDGANSAVSYNIQDNDANIVAALNDNGNPESALLAAASVKSSDGTALDIQTILAGQTNFIAGTKAEIDAMSTILSGDQVAYEVSVADLAANEAFYGNLPTNATFIVSDTAANLLGGNATLAAAGAIIVTDAVSVADAASIRALSALDADPTYSLSDTAVNLAAAGDVGTDAVNITATDAATFAQGTTILAFSPTTLVMNISQADLTNHAANTANAATNITITGALTHTDAATILGNTNSGTTTLASVTGTSAQLAALTVGDATITAVTGSDNATADQITTILGFTTPSAYSLTDSVANLVALPSSTLNGATNLVSTGEATVAQATVLDAATNSGTTTFGITDAAANIVGASDALLGLDANTEIEISDASITAAVATSLTAQDTAAAGYTIHHGGNAGVYVLSDTHANLTAAANATAVAASTSVTVTDTLTVAQGVTLEAAATADASPAYSLSDSYANLVVNQSGASALPMGDVDVTVTGTLSVAQAKVVEGYTTNSAAYNLSDTAANVFASVGHAAVTGATSVTLSSAATVAQAAAIAELANLTGGYSISDTASNVQAAMDTANAASAGDIALLNAAASVVLTDNATVAEAAGDIASESDGLYNLSGLSYGISDTVTNMLTGLAGTDAAAITGASSLNATDTTAMSVANATTLTSLSNWVGHDHDGDAATAGLYYLSDGFAAVQGADATLVNTAATVVATGTAGADIMNMSMHSAGMTINGLADDDVITGTSGADTITGGTGADTITGGDGDDDFVFSTAATNGADTITVFVSTEDELDLQALTLEQGADAQTDLLTAADGAEASVVTAAFATGQANAAALGVIVVTDEAATDWSDVAAVIEAALTVDGTAANNSTVAIIVDNGTDTRLYNYTDVTDGFAAADDLTLLATISDIETAGFVATDFIA
ncbi:hypothetical protein N8075_06170 [Planktomarina temperata]|nr:hypothetical protein [Planktomarina temperata]